MFAWLLLAAAASTDAKAAYDAGVAAFQKRDFATAERQLRRAVEADARHAAAWKALGVVHAAQEDYAGADIPFQKACELDTRLEDACYYYGRNAFALNRFELSLEAMRKALRHDSRPWRVHLGMAQALEGLGRASEAEEQYRRSIQLMAQPPSAPDYDPRLHYSVFLYRQARLEQALAAIRPVTADYPRAARPQVELGRTLLQLGRLDDAARALEQAITVEPKSSQGHLLLGRIYARLGDPEKAARHSRLGASLAAEEVSRTSR
ncbi:MAG TPA: tetratricopeptide repeat protein [Bryobacteraceae bacterium]|nr:tetratricopeptide repeat protein [Bryobacteraceae bacterium]